MSEQIINYFSSNTGALKLQDIILNFLVAAVLSLLIYIAYKLTHSGALYSPRFNISISMLVLVTTLVMSVIGNNIALSLGMVGALSIVRFRTAIKDPRDTVFIFWSIAIGVCCGVSEYIVAAIGSAVIFAFLIIFGLVKNNDRYILVIRADRDSKIEIGLLIEAEYKGKARLRVENTSKESSEFIYELSEKMLKKASKKEVSVTDLLYKIEGVSNVNLICQNDDINR